uniref:vasorin-like n=1 Tax=Ciona intestinalis TaxID=7719 RepID=UPI000180CECA|nr:vasorin-like [Ciona intestinalis]|eukprot:XP_018673264.1 vasorin-like [Ciona intestinalis]
MTTWATTYLALVMLLVAKMTSSTMTCPRLCSCHSREVWCENQGLTEIPVGIPVDTRKLYLFDNNITTIPEGSLSRLKGLQFLVLTSNGLTNDAIRPGLFSQLKELEVLILSNNKLTTITNDMFAGMPKLVRLYIEKNRLRTIAPKALFNMTKLVELKLSGNQLTNFPKIKSCPKLRRLSLNNNKLARLQFDSLSEVNLEELELSSNRLTQLPSTTFRDMSNFGVLDLSLNRIRRLPRIIKNMTSLHSLNLSCNSISFLPPDLLQSLRKIKVLDLHDLRLSSLSESFIPRGVLFNVADFSMNPWRCDCDLSWLPNIMRAIPGAFINVDSVQCATPVRWQHRKLNSLYDHDLKCNRGPSLPPRDKDTASHPHRPTVDLCDGIVCANGAPCYINNTTNRPVCRCPPHWTGMLCDHWKALPTPPTSTTTTTTLAARAPSGNVPHLIIQSDTITPNSVGIILPSTGRSLKVTVTEILAGRKSTPNEYTIVPTTHPYTVNDLEAGKKYNICITSSDIIRSTGGRDKIVTDTLCGEVTTLNLPASGSPDETTKDYDSNYVEPDKVENKVIPPPTVVDAPVVDPGDDEKQTGDTNPSVDTQHDFPLLYPALGAGLGAFVILVVAILFFVCYKNKKKQKKQANNNDSIKPSEYSRGRPSNGICDPDMIPMMMQQVPRPTVTTSMVTPQGEIYQHPPHNHTQNGAIQPLRVSTPNKNGSLGRSSNSGGSVCGAPMSQPGEIQRGYSPGSNVSHTVPKDGLEEPRYVTSPNCALSYPSNGGVYSTQIPYTTTQQPPPHTNRGHEFLYRAHPGSLAAETIAETRYGETQGLVPRPTCTTVNHYHHSPIATTMGPDYAYQQHVNGLVTGYSQPTVPQITRSPVRYTPSTQMGSGVRFPDQRVGHLSLDRYGPAITSGHMIDPNMSPAFHDTLVM